LIPAGEIKVAISIIFNAINVNGQETNGTVSIGEVSQSAWSAHSKQNMGIAMTFGLTWTIRDVSVIFDRDVIDMPVNNTEVPITSQVQGV
jgi:ABC-type branched-subunit amino acid transport system ATPase component